MTTGPPHIPRPLWSKVTETLNCMTWHPRFARLNIPTYQAVVDHLDTCITHADGCPWPSERQECDCMMAAPWWPFSMKRNLSE